MIERASELQGLLVVTREEGALLGSLCDVSVDTQAKRIAAFGHRHHRVGGADAFVPVSRILSLGRDLVLVSTEEAVSKVTKATPLPGKSLKDLRGVWVTAMDGRHLGTLLDVEFSPEDWGITQLYLADDKLLAVDCHQIEIGDEILVPTEYAHLIEDLKEAKPGLLERALGREVVEDTRKILKRALGKRAKPQETAGTGT